VKKNGQKIKVVGQQHQGSGRLTKQNNSRNGNKRKEVVESPKQRRKRIYAQRAEEERALRPPISQSAKVPFGASSCICGRCISCILLRDRKEQERRADQQRNRW